MKNLILVTFLMISVPAIAQTGKKKVVYNYFKTFHIDLNNDQKIDTIVLSSSVQGSASFDRISILMSGTKRTIFKAKNEWTEIQPEFLAANKNLLNSKSIFVKKTNMHTVIILSGGTDGAGYGGEFSIINIENNNVKMVFDYSSDEHIDSVDTDIELPAKLIDLGNNERLCFIYSSYGEVYKSVKGGQIGTYHPFYVFPVTDNYTFSNLLTKAYNKKHYVYVDPKHRGEIEIFYPDNQKLKPRHWKY